MSGFAYYSGGQLRSIRVSHISGQRPVRAQASRAKARALELGHAAASRAIVATLGAQKKRMSTRYHDAAEDVMVVQTRPDATTRVFATATVAIDGARTAEVRWLERMFGLATVQEGRQGKVLMRAPEGGSEGVRIAFQAARECFERGVVAAAHPNFVRVQRRPVRSSRSKHAQWNLDNPGKPGLPGADVRALAAWTITRGVPEVRVAVLDEGVDALHPSLKGVVVAEADFVDENTNAQPDGSDAHGTCCAGIIGSQHDKVRGLAPGVRLVAARIAKSNPRNTEEWVFDDFDTADAIDWSWDEARADVLSNSWGGDPPVDAITNAFERARSKGRRGKGAVIVIAAGNDQAPLDFPGNLPRVLTVGASNPWDERKTKTSKDGEDWWGSNYGSRLDILAPGVWISTTDIRGGHGYSTSDFTHVFNGTSSAAPHCAAAAALVLSIAPGLSEERVRDLLCSTADPMVAGGRWNRFVGHGRLNVYNALQAARRG